MWMVNPSFILHATFWNLDSATAGMRLNMTAITTPVAWFYRLRDNGRDGSSSADVASIRALKTTSLWACLPWENVSQRRLFQIPLWSPRIGWKECDYVYAIGYHCITTKSCTECCFSEYTLLSSVWNHQPYAPKKVHIVFRKLFSNFKQWFHDCYHWFLSLIVIIDCYHWLLSYMALTFISFSMRCIFQAMHGSA